MSTCKKLTDNYNTNILDTVDPIISNEFLKISTKYRGGNKGRTVLMDLIYNHYNNTKPCPKFIGGPKTLTSHWNEEYQMMVYIFGEWHSNKMDCKNFKEFKIGEQVPVEVFLAELIRTTDVFIDIYFEFSPYKGEEYDEEYAFLKPNPAEGDDLLSKFFKIEEDRLTKLFEHFKTCIQYSTRAAAECRLARVHYFDIRFNRTKDRKENRLDDVSWFLVEISDILSKKSSIDIKVTNFLKFMQDNPRIKRVLDALITPKDIDFQSFWIKQIRDNVHAMKEVDKSPLKPKIMEFIDKETIIEAMKYRQDFIKYIPTIFTDKTKDYLLLAHLQIIINYIRNTNALIADVYTLSRMFRNFNITKPAYKGGPINDQPVKPHNVIIYAGDGHSRQYRKFLESINFKEISKSGSSEIKEGEPKFCVDMKTFKEPFFLNDRVNKNIA